MISNSVTRATKWPHPSPDHRNSSKKNHTLHTTFSFRKDECETNTDRSTPFAQRTHLWQLNKDSPWLRAKCHLLQVWADQTSKQGQIICTKEFTKIAEHVLFSKGNIVTQKNSKGSLVLAELS